MNPWTIAQKGIVYLLFVQSVRITLAKPSGKFVYYKEWTLN